MSGIGLSEGYVPPERTAAAQLDASVRPAAAPTGIGLAGAYTPDPRDNDGGAPVPDVNTATITPPPIDTSSLSQMPALPAAAPAPVAAAPSDEPLVDWHKDPLSAIGLVLSSTAAGINGTESPVAQLKKQRLEEQAMQYKTAALALDVVDKTSAFVSKLPASQRDAAIADLDQRFSPALGGHSIGGFLKAITSGNDQKTAATLGALKALNPSPAMM
jgi:hypothetical protein